MKQAKDIDHDDMAEVVFLGVMMPALARFIDEQGWLLQPWPSGNESATDDPKYHSFIVTPRDIPGSAIEGLTPEQATAYAAAFDAALETGVGVDERVPRTEDARTGPHSRACGIKRHDHGTECHFNCPTCRGSEVPR